MGQLVVVIGLFAIALGLAYWAVVIARAAKAKIDSVVPDVYEPVVYATADKLLDYVKAVAARMDGQGSTLSLIAALGVALAEATIRSKNGVVKKEFVMSVLEQAMQTLQAQGVEVNLSQEQLSDIVEAAVSILRSCGLEIKIEEGD
jgi:hypothetical protein